MLMFCLEDWRDWGPLGYATAFSYRASPSAHIGSHSVTNYLTQAGRTGFNYFEGTGGWVELDLGGW